METRKTVEDKIFNENWDSLLKMFNTIKFNEREKYESLKELAKTKQLTHRQMDGIISRCNYRIHLIDNPTEEPFSNMEKKETREFSTNKAQLNGKP